MTKFGLALSAALLASTACYGAAPPPPRGDPLKGVVLGDDVVTCTDDGKSSSVYVCLHSLRHDTEVRGRPCALANRSPIRWQIGSGALWVSDDWDPFGFGLNRDARVAGGILARVDQTDLFKKGNILNRPGDIFPGETHARFLSHIVHTEKYFLYFDYLPAGKRGARQFMTTNMASERPDKGRDFSFRKGNPPPRLFSSYVYDSRLNELNGRRYIVPWRREWCTRAAFEEPFQALALGDDYYFVTRSGSVYRAAKPAKGTDRTLARVWDGKGRPVESFVSDAATGKTFLFVPPAKAGGRPAFFELSDKPRPEEYDPKLVPLPKLDEPHRTVVHAARVLVALKKIEGKAAPKAGEKEPAKP